MPVQPGITAATGLLVTDLQYEYTHSTLLILDKAGKDEFAKANAALDELFARANQQLDADGIPPTRRRFRQIAECRYAGQGFELRADMPDGHLGKAVGGSHHREFLPGPQAGLWPRLPRPVLRDHHAARRGDRRGRHAEAAEARQGRAQGPGRCRALRQAHGVRRRQGAGDAALPARQSCSPTTASPVRR